MIGETTYRLVADYFDTRPLGELSVRGKAEPIRAWTVEAAREGRTRLEAGVQRGLTPLVGRGRELEALEAALARTRAGHGQVVFVVGEPGIGKSRLLYEFRGRAGDADWREGHCLSIQRLGAAPECGRDARAPGRPPSRCRTRGTRSLNTDHTPDRR